tara:strand:+ start:2382 stop:2834 length:453 start_codon:yes stop_codon:yes gene_type:complete
MLLGLLLLILIVGSSDAGDSFIEGDANFILKFLFPNGSYLDGMFYLIYVVGISCAAAAILFGLVSFVTKSITDFKAQIGTLVGISVFITIGLLSYFALADSAVLDAYEISGITVSPAESIFAGGSMIYVYILALSAVSVVVWAEVSSIFK